MSTLASVLLCAGVLVRVAFSRVSADDFGYVNFRLSRFNEHIIEKNFLMVVALWPLIMDFVVIYYLFRPLLRSANDLPNMRNTFSFLLKRSHHRLTEAEIKTIKDLKRLLPATVRKNNREYQEMIAMFTFESMGASAAFSAVSLLVYFVGVATENIMLPKVIMPVLNSAYFFGFFGKRSLWVN
jgi:hypothetical protein